MQKLSSMRESSEIQELSRQGFAEIMNFVTTESFQSVVNELYSKPYEERPKFVFDVLLSANELKIRGVETPENLIIQRSHFEDQRPTLFCITKMLPSGCGWEKITLTFDNPN